MLAPALYLDMHGLIFETSICYWQDKPDIFPFMKRREAGLSRHILPPFPTRHLHVCLDQVKLVQAKAEFQKLELAGIIRQSDSPWASPLHMVQKSDGSWRPCGSYRCLNNVTRPDRYPLPNIHDFTNNLRGCKFFSKLYLVKGYNQVPMSEADNCKTAIVTQFGLFQFLYMLFGLKNAAQTFQRLMDRIFRGLPFVFIYLEDVLVASRTRKLHIEHLRVVLELLVQNRLVLNLV